MLTVVEWDVEGKSVGLGKNGSSGVDCRMKEGYLGFVQYGKKFVSLSASQE